MEHYAIRLRCSPLPSPPLHLSYGSKRYENATARGSKFNLKFNHAALDFPQFTTNNQFARSFKHANCMVNNSFSVPNSKNIEGSENKISRGMSRVSLVLGCILGIINFSGMMNPKISMALPFDPNKTMMIAGGENSFDSLWKTVNAEGIESVDNKKMHVVDMLKDLRTEYNNCKDDPERERSLRRPLIELLLIQGNFHEADDEIDKHIYPKLVGNTKFFRGTVIKINYEEKIDKLLKKYRNDKTFDFEKQSIADIFLYKAIIHTKLKDKEAAKWWEAFAKTLTDE